MTLKPPHETFVPTDAELIELWRDLMGSDGFDQRSLWVCPWPIHLATRGSVRVFAPDDLIAA